MSAAISGVVCVASWNADLVSLVARPIGRGETLRAESFAITPGGKGSNAAVAAARQGALVALIARIGGDDFGRMALDLWRAEGIVADHVEQAAGERSGVAQIMVYPDGDNSIAVHPGAGSGLAARHARAAAASLSACRAVMASCEVPLAAAAEAFRIARAAGAQIVLNPAPAGPLPGELLALVDVLTPNESEARTLAELGPDAPMEKAAEALLARGVKAVLATLGAKGCCLYRQALPPLALPGWRVKVADTIGAGDTFTGVLAAALARGEKLVEAMRWANAAAALSVTAPGAIGGMPSLAQVESLLRLGDNEASQGRAK